METTLHVFINNRLDLEFLRLREPYIVEMPTMRIIEEASLFLRSEYVQSGRCASPHTWRMAAYNLVSWLVFLRCRGTAWEIATRDDLIAYRDAHLGQVSPYTGRQYSSTTINLRMLTINAFYAFAYEMRWYSGSLHTGDKLSIGRLPEIDRNALVHTQRGTTARQLNELAPKRRRNRQVIRPFTKEEWRRFALHLGPRPSEQSQHDPRSCRDRLICELAIVTGLRLSELMKLTYLDFAAMSPDRGAPFVGQPLIVNSGKGKKSRLSVVPNWLVEEVLIYIRNERAKVLFSIDTRKASPADLFLSSGESKSPGRPMTARRYQQIVEATCIKAGLVRFEHRDDFQSRSLRTVQFHKHSFHDLRHTCAVWSYEAEIAKGNPEPFKKVQQILGHERLATTIDTYLHYVSLFGEVSPSLNVRDLIGL